MSCKLSQTGTNGATTQTVATITVAVVAVNTTDSDNTGMLADLANDRIVCKRPNTYLATAALTYENLTAGSANTQCRLHKNGTVFIADSRRANTGDYPSPLVVVPVVLAVGDYVDLRAYQNSGANQAFYQETSSGTIVFSLTEQPSW